MTLPASDISPKGIIMADFTPAADRLPVLLEAIDMHASRYGGTARRPHHLGFGISDAARYTIEAHVPGYRPGEWGWTEDYIRANVHVLEREPFTPSDIEGMVKSRREYRASFVSSLLRQAQGAYKAGAYDTADELVDQAGTIRQGDAAYLDTIRDVIRRARSTTMPDEVPSVMNTETSR